MAQEHNRGPEVVADGPALSTLVIAIVQRFHVLELIAHIAGGALRKLRGGVARDRLWQENVDCAAAHRGTCERDNVRSTQSWFIGNVLVEYGRRSERGV